MGMKKREQVVEAPRDEGEELEDVDDDVELPEHIQRLFTFLESRFSGQVVEVEDECFEGGRMIFDFTSHYMQILDCGVVGGAE